MDVYTTVIELCTLKWMQIFVLKLYLIKVYFLKNHRCPFRGPFFCSKTSDLVIGDSPSYHLP